MTDLPLGPSPKARRLALYTGVSLIAGSGLVLEISLTRLFSATIWYHYAFVAVAVAMLGWGLGGFGLHLLRHRLRLGHKLAGGLGLAYGIAIPLSLSIILLLPLDPARLPFYMATAVVPFLFGGATLSAVFAAYQRDAGRLYWADLLGAAAGAGLVAVLLAFVGCEGAMLMAALAAFAAVVCLGRVWRKAALVMALLTAALFVLQRSDKNPLTIRAPTKALYQHLAAEPEARVAMTGANAYSRIDVVTGLKGPLARLYIDSDAWTDVHAWNGDVGSLGGLRDWYRALPATLVQPRTTLVIGPGGGTDVLTALASGSERVTAVELNPLVLRFVRSFGGAAGNLYDHPAVRTVLAEGRSFLATTREQFDMIVLGFVDSWAQVASGGLSLSENYLYTTEALRAYLDHLTPDGMLVILRWDADVPRLVANSVALLGPEQARLATAVVREKSPTQGPPQVTFMLKRQPFDTHQTAAMTSWRRAEPILVPGRLLPTPYESLLRGDQSLAQYDAQSPERVTPVTDEQPFFFARQKPWGLPDNLIHSLRWILAPVLLLALALVAIGKPPGAARASYLKSVAYFGCLGMGFILIELAVLQQLTFVVGHPIFTLSLLLLSLLCAGGLGSLLSRRFAGRAACLVVAALAISYAFGLPAMLGRVVSFGLTWRIALSVLLVAPLGLAMGMPFPLGLGKLASASLSPAPFYWGLNGVFSVVGSVASVLIAVNLGFTAVLVVGALLYALAAAVARY